MVGQMMLVSFHGSRARLRAGALVAPEEDGVLADVARPGLLTQRVERGAGEARRCSSMCVGEFGQDARGQIGQIFGAVAAAKWGSSGESAIGRSTVSGSRTRDDRTESPPSRELRPLKKTSLSFT
jgi:hypothetical protein